MWNLVMGALMSSEDEGENHTTQGEGEFQEEGENPALKGDGRNQTNISTTKQGTDEFGVSKGVLDANDDLQVAGSAARNINQDGGPSQVHSAELHKREEGDGMEKPVLVKTPSEIFKVTSVVLPETGVALDKIPPISDKVDLRPVHPTSTLVKEKAKIYPKGTLPPAVKKSKEAKFVPCEPYKGAVSPMSANNPPGSRKCSRKSPAKTLSAPNLMLNKSLSPRRQDSNATADDETDALFMLNTSSSRTAAADSKDANRQNSINEDSVEEDDEEMNPMLKENYQAMLEAKERELNRLRSGLEDAEKQLRIQSQVNGELKSLLVASVGEDIEARLDFLTQDKARLAADVVQYNNKISRDWEEKEALHVESDIWRSKFLASTVILEELTRTKQALESRNHQLEHAARRILMERKEMGTKLYHVDMMLRSVLVSHGVVDTDQVNTDETAAAADMMKLTADIESSTNKICDKLAGDKGLRYTSATEPEHRLTQAERDLEQLLVNSQRHDESDLPDQASCRLTRGARTLLMKMGDKAQSPGKSAFNSCSHCNGTVETV